MKKPLLPKFGRLNWINAFLKIEFWQNTEFDKLPVKIDESSNVGLTVAPLYIMHRRDYAFCPDTRDLH